MPPAIAAITRRWLADDHCPPHVHARHRGKGWIARVQLSFGNNDVGLAADRNVLADIGGGNGSLLAAVLLRYPHLRGILFDLGHVAGRARVSMQTLGLQERCSLVEGNFFESIPEGADTYLLRHIIHDWTDEQSVQVSIPQSLRAYLAMTDATEEMR